MFVTASIVPQLPVSIKFLLFTTIRLEFSAVDRSTAYDPSEACDLGYVRMYHILIGGEP